MKAVRIHKFGGPEVLRSESIDRPLLKPGEVLVRIQGAGINPVDAKIRAGSYPRVTQDQLPIVLGRDICGLIKEDSGVHTEWRSGMEVFALLEWSLGGYAQYVAVSGTLCAQKPRKLDAVAAASVPLAGLTAWQGLFDHGKLTQGQSVLVHGGAGGVGHLAIQFAKVRGARVLATAASEDLDFVAQLGADVVIDYRKQRFESVARDIDVVFDLVGSDTRERSWQVLKPGGVLVSTLGQPDEGRAAEHGVRAAGYVTAPSGAQLNEIRKLIDEGRVTPTVSASFSLDAAADAHRYLEGRHPRGKLAFAVEE
ncbi:MAG TPA: NADP-dependent oxidoreductase [Steroidobacteraceae bacterium]|nr:NADP-dependent oxidoreductase [Steroidobacteraceae bacterium]